jgi:hypothetical protein
MERLQYILLDSNQVSKETVHDPGSFRATRGINGQLKTQSFIGSYVERNP